MENSTKPEKPVGHNAKQQSSDDTSFALAILEAIIADAVQQLTYRRVDAEADLRTIKNRAKSEGLPFITQTLPRFISDFFLLLEGGKPSFEGFKKRPSSQLPVLLYGLTSMVVESVEQDYKALDFLYSLCHSFKKLKGDYPESVLSDCLDKFIATDRELMSLKYNSIKLSKRIVARARHFVSRLFQHADIGDLTPKPGSGATNTPLGYELRFRPHVHYAQLEDSFPYKLWFYSNAWGFKSSIGKYFALARAEYPKSRLKFIHKYVGKPRGICIEENETQWIQQALKGFLYPYIENHYLTRGHINFVDQSVNREFALSSSRHRRYCTIDMSEASDRISRELVFQIFRDTCLLESLNAASTRIIQYPKEVASGEMLVQKFAPMGSAVCFPIMAIVHYSLIKAVIELAMPGNTRKLSKQIYVYGDDIIAPSECADAIFTHLPHFGMKLNKEKSFLNSYFRESCGVHAYKGHDITPVYNNYTLTSSHVLKDSTRLLSLIAKEALYTQKGFEQTAAILRRHIINTYGPIPFGEPSSRLLCFKRDNAPSLTGQLVDYPRRWNVDLQHFEYRVRVTRTRYDKPVSLTQGDALLRWFTTKTEDSSKYMDFDRLKLVYQWLPKSCLGRHN